LSTQPSPWKFQERGAGWFTMHLSCSRSFSLKTERIPLAGAPKTKGRLAAPFLNLSADPSLGGQHHHHLAAFRAGGGFDLDAFGQLVLHLHEQLHAQFLV